MNPNSLVASFSEMQNTLTRLLSEIQGQILAAARGEIGYRCDEFLAPAGAPQAENVI